MWSPAQHALAPLALTLSLLVSGPAAAEIVLRIATPAPDGSPWHRNLQELSLEWREISDGEVKLRIYPGGVAGDEAESLRKLEAGKLDAVQLTNIGLGEVCPESQVLSIPMLFDSFAEFDYVRRSMAAELESSLGNRGLTPLAWSDAGWIRFFSSVPARSAAEFQALKLFTWRTDDETIEFWQESGFRPVGELTDSLGAGLRDGAVESLPMTAVTALATQTFNSAANMLDLRWAPSLTGVIVSTAAWEQIPAGLRPQLRAAARELAEALTRQVREFESESLETMQQHGLVIHQPTAKIEAEWRVTALRTHRLIRGEIVPEGIFDRAVDLVEEHRRQQIENVGER